jgi:hypothetical protein
VSALQHLRYACQLVGQAYQSLWSAAQAPDLGQGRGRSLMPKFRIVTNLILYDQRWFYRAARTDSGVNFMLAIGSTELEEILE